MGETPVPSLLIAAAKSSSAFKQVSVVSWVIHGSVGPGDTLDVASAAGRGTPATVKWVSVGSGGPSKTRLTNAEHVVNVGLAIDDRSFKLFPGFELRGRVADTPAPHGLSETERARVWQMLEWCRANGYYTPPSVGFLLPKTFDLQACRNETALEVFDAWAAETGSWPQPLDDAARQRLRTASARLMMLATALGTLGMVEEGDRYLLRAMWIDERTPMTQGEKAGAAFVALAAGALAGAPAGLATGLEVGAAGLSAADARDIPAARVKDAWDTRSMLVREGRAFAYGYCQACGAVVQVDASWRCPQGHPASDVQVAVRSDAQATIDGLMARYSTTTR